MRNLGSLLVLFCFVLQTNAQIVTYSGPVEYYLEVSKTAKGKGTDGGFNWGVSIDDRRIIKGSFYVTFSGNATGVDGLGMFQLTDIKENIEFSHKANNEGNDQESMGKDMPDSERSRSYKFYASLLSPETPVITGGFMMIQNGKYHFMLSGEMEVSNTSEIATKETYPINKPPTMVSETATFKYPVTISGEANSENLKYLEGSTALQDEQSDDCRKCMDGNLASLVHGDMDCSYISKTTTSWTLVKRNKECDARVTYIKGDVKINGMPAEQGAVKVGAGDVIETGPKSRIAISLKNGSEAYRLGSKSKLQLNDPCKPDTYKPPGKGQAVINFLQGKVFTKRVTGNYTRDDFDSEKEWEYFQAMNITWFRTTVIGVRGWMPQAPAVYYASTDPGFGVFLNQPEDPEKVALIEDGRSLPEKVIAIYLDYQDGVVNDLTVLKGTIRVEDELGLKSMVIHEGTTLNQWEDGTSMTEIVILTR